MDYEFWQNLSMRRDLEGGYVAWRSYDESLPLWTHEKVLEQKVFFLLEDATRSKWLKMGENAGVADGDDIPTFTQARCPHL